MAIAHTLTITDALADHRWRKQARHKDSTRQDGREQFYLWEDNEFIQGEPYDRLMGPVSTGTAKAALDVRKVIYSDGTSQTYSALRSKDVFAT
ncbi:hypothetical protein [Rhizobium hidalgonense]|uniref:hypothetical protein n=1 Tax=Rhizobium hidalgonense TaxID=1538159 RepID=UPI00287130D3|nr:hypothetical protein [Rhizobium hidalgonense]MDR9808893.1 hypothetical protein [Rhizobium hidalgonense]